MATMNPFDLLGDDDNDDPSQLLAAQQLKAPAASAPAPATKKGPTQAQPTSQPKAQPQAQAKLPSKPLPPSQAVREAKNEAQRGGGRGGGGRGDGRGRGRGRGGRGGRGFDRDTADNENMVASNNGFSGGYNASEDGDAGRTGERRGYGGPRGGFHGARRGGFSNGETAEGERGERHPRRMFDRHSGTGRGNGLKREGSGRGNWGTPTDEIAPDTEEPVNESEKNVDAEKQQSGEETVGDANKDSPAEETEEKEKEPEDKEMTLEEYQKVLGERRKNLLATKPEERKVNLDKDFESMQLLSNKKNDDDAVFIKLGSDKDKRKDAGEKAKKAVSINEFLKPAEGEGYYRPGGRGRGRGRDRRGSGGNMYNVDAPSIENVKEFPSLGGK